MSHPVAKLDIIAALEANAVTIAAFFSGVPEPILFDGDPEHWSPAHHLVHLTKTNMAVARGLRSGALPIHSSGRSRTYAETRDAAASSLAATARDQLRDMGRTVVIAPGTGRVDVVHAFVASGEELRDAAAGWSEDALDRHALVHPLMGELTVREMLFFMVFHERHHLKRVRMRLEDRLSPEP